MTRDPFARCLVFVDAALADYQHLVQGAVDGATVVVLASDRPGVAQITTTLQQHPNVEQVHVVSHGAPGTLYLGNDSLSSHNLEAYRPQLSTWFSHPTDLLLYGCDVAAGEQGAAFVHQLSDVTGAAIAASNDRTGNADLGGDWDLEVTVGDVTSPLAFPSETLSTYAGVLATFNVAAGDVAGLIAAIDAANANRTDADIINLTSGTYALTTFATGTDAFQFPGGFFFGKTGLPYIVSPITINGNGATISGPANAANPFRLFLVDGQITGNTGNLTLNNVTLSGGRTEASVVGKNGFYDDGGAIAINYNGSVTINNSTITSNTAVDDGGAIFNLGSLQISGSTLSNNTALTGDGGAIENDGVGNTFDPNLRANVLTLTDTNITGNSAPNGQGGAIRNSRQGLVDITGGNITGNTAASGGGIANIDNSTINVVGANVSGNTATTPGAPADFGGASVINVSLANAGTPAEQGTTPGTFRVSLSAAAPTGGSTIEFKVGGTATFTTDYTVAGAASFTGTNGTITVPAGATSATMTLTPVDDALFDPNETVQLTLTGGPNAGGGTIYNIANTPSTLTIADNELPNNPTITQVSNNLNIFLVGNSGGNVSFTLNQRNTNNVNELGVFLVDDDAGTVAGQAPGSAGYTAAVLARSTVLYSVLGSSRSGGLLPLSDSSRELQYASGSRLRFYLVNNSSVDSVLAGQTPTSQVSFATSSNLQAVSQGNNTFNLRFEDGDNGDFNDLAVTFRTTTNTTLVKGTTFQGVREVVDLTGTAGGQVSIAASEATFNNTIGFYRVTDALTGSITTSAGTFRPGDTDYARQAVLNRVTSNNLTAGSIYAPFLISNNTAENFVAGQGTAFFAYVGANVDGRDHVRLLGSNLFGFEDVIGGGDNDFNDAIVRVTVS